MANPAVSVGLPVFNGELFLAEAIQSLLSQSFEDLELIISDNGSSDDTESICREFAVSDSRVRYTRFDTNVGASRNFNRVFELSKGRYFKWAAHDDVHLPEYIEKCVEVLESDSAAVVAYTRAYSIDDSGSRLRDAWGESPELNSPSVDLRFRRCIGQQVNPIPLPIFGVMRSSALSRSRLFVDTPDSDRALLAELALHGRFRELEEVLFLQREHRRRAGPRLAENPYYAARFWGALERKSRDSLPHWALMRRHLESVLNASVTPGDKMRCLHEIARWSTRQRSRLLQDLLTGTRWIPFGSALHDRMRIRKLRKQVRRTEAEIYETVPLEATIALVDEHEIAFGADPCPKRKTLLFMEQDGYYSINPPDDETALMELDRLRKMGADFLALGWSAFWWLDYYQRFGQHLFSNYRLILRNDRLAIFKLRD